MGPLVLTPISLRSLTCLGEGRGTHPLTRLFPGDNFLRHPVACCTQSPCLPRTLPAAAPRSGGSAPAPRSLRQSSRPLLAPVRQRAAFRCACQSRATAPPPEESRVGPTPPSLEVPGFPRPFSGRASRRRSQGLLSGGSTVTPARSSE